MATQDALRLARERGLDLVEVNASSVPPVTKILDYGQYKYETSRREKDARRNQRGTELKEIRMSNAIGIADEETKVRRAVEFLTSGHKVKMTVRHKGRAMTHPEIGRNLLLRMAQSVGAAGIVEQAPLMEGKNLSILLGPATTKAA
jgi:translation initiation factor IF-3